MLWFTAESQIHLFHPAHQQGGMLLFMINCLLSQKVWLQMSSWKTMLVDGPPVLEKKAAECWPPNPDSSADNGMIPRYTGTQVHRYTGQPRGGIHINIRSYQPTICRSPIGSECFSAEEEEKIKTKRQKKNGVCLVPRHPLLPGIQYSVWYPDNSIFCAFPIFYDK